MCFLCFLAEYLPHRAHFDSRMSNPSESKLPTKMATKRPKMESSADAPDKSTDDPKELVARLRADLDAEKKATKNLRREKSYEVSQVREQEVNRASVALKDLKAKLHADRLRELEAQKEALNRKFDLEMQKVVKQKDAELLRTQNDLRKSQDELQEVTKRGLSGAARGAFRGRAFSASPWGQRPQIDPQTTGWAASAGDWRGQTEVTRDTTAAGRQPKYRQ